ncbi:hypothetical protein B5S32_g5634 [[Candida] boidinii]|nr:hypothetical protein B5S32_g5634 [[Candida] boidinii]
MFLNNLKFIEIIFPEVNSYSSSFDINDTPTANKNKNKNDTLAHLGTLLNPIPTTDINSMNFNYNSDKTFLDSIFNDNESDSNNLNNIDETIFEFNKIFNNFNIKSKLNINTQNNKLNFKILHQISIIFKKFIGIKTEIENSFDGYNENDTNNNNNNNSFNVMKYQSNLKYLKIFNVIICVDDIKNIKFKTNSLDEWFNLKLTGNL